MSTVATSNAVGETCEERRSASCGLEPAQFVGGPTNPEDHVQSCQFNDRSGSSLLRFDDDVDPPSTIRGDVEVLPGADRGQYDLITDPRCRSGRST